MLNRTKRIQKEKKEKELERNTVENEELIKKQRKASMLKSKLKLAYDIKDKADKNAMLLGQLYNSNYIDEEGNPMKSRNDHYKKDKC